MAADCNGPNSVYHHLQRAYAALAAVTEAWPWLAEVAAPGRDVHAGDMPPTPAQQRIEAEQLRRDRAAKQAALKAGTTPTPHADAARPGPLVARADVARAVRVLTERVWGANHNNAAMAWPVVNPTMRQITVACWYCEGRGEAYMPRNPTSNDLTDVWWTTCAICRGFGEVGSGEACAVCGASKACHCDLADATLAAAATVLTRELDRVDSVTLAAEAARTLERADRTARRACRAVEVWLCLHVACPACRRRDMRAEVSSPDRSRWTIRCAFALCRCKGARCPCGRRELAVDGERHSWVAAEWDGPTGLAARLGINLPGTQPAHTAAAEDP